MKIIIRVIIIILGLALIILAANLFVKAPINNECQILQEKGYFETRYDTAGHEDCGIYGNSDFDCNHDRMHEDEDLQYYRTYCVWGSKGYFQLLGYVSLMVIGSGFIISGFLPNKELEK